MELPCLTIALLLSVAMTLTVTSALPYPAWFQPQNKEDAYPADLHQAVNTLQGMLARQLLKEKFGPTLQNLAADNPPEEGSSISKRLDFGFAGIDNMDHILSVLARKQSSRGSGSGSAFFKNMKSQGYRGGSNIEEMRQIMRNAG